MLFNSLLSINSPWISVVPFLPPSKLHLGYYRDLFIECLLLHLLPHSLLCLSSTVFALVSHAFELIVIYLCLFFFLSPPSLSGLSSFSFVCRLKKKGWGVKMSHRFWVSGWALLLFPCTKCTQIKTEKSPLLALPRTINYYWRCKWPLLNTTVWDASNRLRLFPLCAFSLPAGDSLCSSLFANPRTFFLLKFHVSHRERERRTSRVALFGRWQKFIRDFPYVE